MGLAASQGRYLCLTARMSDLVYEGQQLSQQKLALATESQEISKKYNEAMNNMTMQVTTPEGGTQPMTYDILTSQDPFSGLGMRIVDLDGNVVVPAKKESIEVSSQDEDGNPITSSITSSAEFIKTYMPNLSSDKENEIAGLDLKGLAEYYNKNFSGSGVSAEYKTNINSSLKSENERFLFDENVSDPNYIQEMLTSGQWLLEQARPNSEEGWDSISWQGSSAITQVYDTTDDAAAEAEYEAAMLDIQKKDKMFDLRLEQVQTEESAVEKELDSVKQVISKNVENGFGTFA